MVVHAKKRSFDDPGTLKLRASQWASWHLKAPQWVRGKTAQGKTGHTRAKADPIELAKALKELEA